MIVAKTLDYFETEFAKAVKYLEKYAEDPQEETLHQFRVEIKKIRSVFGMMEELRGDKKIAKWHRQVRSIFRNAGIIRELQLEKNWLNIHRKFNLIRQLRYEDKIIKANKNLQKAIPGMLKKLGKVRVNTEHILSELTQQQASLYVKRKWRESLVMVLHLDNESHWHETRKNIKQFLYAKQWIPDDVYVSGKIKKIFNQLNRLQEIIGKWHDLEVLLLKLKTFGTYLEGHSNLKREHQLALRKIYIEKDFLASAIRNTKEKIIGLMTAYHSK